MELHQFESLNVSLEDNGRLVVVKLDHGRANEMGQPELLEWSALVDHLCAGQARVLLTFSQRKSKKGTPIFISGANVTERAGWTDEQVRKHVRMQRDVLRRLRQAPVFHIAVVDGVAFGWGTEFLICCDYRIAGPGARFALPETGLGILPGAGGTAELWSLIGVSQTLRLGMTGEKLAAEEATRIGLVQESAADLEAGLARARTLASAVMRRSPSGVAAFKTGVLGSVGRAPDERMELEARAYEHCLDSGDAAIGRANFRKVIAGEEVEWAPLAKFSG